MEKESWSLKELKDHIRLQPGDQTHALAFLSSMDWSDRIFRYHFREARDALRAIPIDQDPNSVRNLELVFMPDGEQDYNFLVVRANVIACIHTVRNAYDHLSQLCNSLLIRPPIPVEKCDFYKVRDKLPSSQLKDEFISLSNSYWFKYIAAYSNMTKHRSLIQQRMHLSFVDGVAGVRFDGFTHDKPYNASMVGDILEGILSVKNQVIACGRALNREMTQANG